MKSSLRITINLPVIFVKSRTRYKWYVKKHDRTIYRIDISTPENQSAFQEFDIPGTPVVVAYNRGEEVERLEGAVSAATYDGFFARRNSSAI